MIRTTDNMYCILNGDLIENATKGSVGDPYTSSAPMDQIKAVGDLLEPIKDKILGATLGNHERRTRKNDGIDVMYFIMDRFNLTDRYDPNGILVFIRFGKHYKNYKTSSGGFRKMCYTVYATHGASSGRTVGSKANALSRLGEIVNADICIISHTHMPITFKEKSYRVDYANNTVNERVTAFINSGATLDYDGYPETLSLKPSCFDNPIAIMNGEKFKVNVLI